MLGWLGRRSEYDRFDARYDCALGLAQMPGILERGSEYARSITVCARRRVEYARWGAVYDLPKSEYARPDTIYAR